VHISGGATERHVRRRVARHGGLVGEFEHGWVAIGKPIGEASCRTHDENGLAV